MRGYLNEWTSPGFEEKHCHLPHVEVNEVLGLVGDIRSEISSDNTMPGGIILLVELLLDVGGDILLNVELFQGNVGAVDRILLHLLVHVGVFDHGFTFSSGHWNGNLNKIYLLRGT